MDFTAIIVVSLIVLVVGTMLYGQYKAKRLEGQPATALVAAIPELSAIDPALVFCYSPTCAPCKNMLPGIDTLTKETGCVFKIDVSANLDLAREVGIRATPTTLLVRQGVVEKVLLGVKSQQTLRDLLEID